MTSAAGKRVGVLGGALLLVILAATAAAMLHVAERETKTQRAENNTLHAARLLGEVIPAGDYDTAPGLRRQSISNPELLGTSATLDAFPVHRDGVAQAVVITAVAPDGYVAPLTLLIGVSTNGQITGVRVAAHRETPGLGDQVDISKSDWIEQFTGTSRALVSEADWELERDGGAFDHISGATITSRAVVHAVRKALDYTDANRERLYAPATTD